MPKIEHQDFRQRNNKLKQSRGWAWKGVWLGEQY